MRVSILPPQSTNTERALEVAGQRLDAMSVDIARLWNPQSCPVEFLPWLAWAFSVDVWDHGWSESIKRKVIGSSIQVHRMKGTRRAVELALAALELRIDLHEGFELDEFGEAYGPPFTFTLDAFADDIFDADFQINAKLYAVISEIIHNVKPARSHFTLRVGEKRGGTVTLRSGSRQRLIDARQVTPALPVDLHAPQLTTRTGHRCIVSSHHIHRFAMGEAT